MSIHDPNFVSTRFASASAGYLTTYAAELILMRAALPMPTTTREWAIYTAIEYGIRHPVEWNARLNRRNT